VLLTYAKFNDCFRNYIENKYEKTIKVLKREELLDIFAQKEDYLDENINMVFKEVLDAEYLNKVDKKYLNAAKKMIDRFIEMPE
jgi:hypothetical protein